jgi:hypothetical protein
VLTRRQRARDLQRVFSVIHEIGGEMPALHSLPLRGSVRTADAFDERAGPFQCSRVQRCRSQRRSPIRLTSLECS